MTALETSAPLTGSLAVVILAAGQGTRLRSKLPKPLHPVGGRPLIDHVLQVAAHLEPAQTVVVTGHGAPALRAHLGLRDGRATTPPPGHRQLIEAFQAEQLGTGHAVATALPLIEPASTAVLVLYADTPLLTAGTLAELAAAHQAGACIAMVTCRAPDPTGYGRIQRDEARRVTAIVEEKAAAPDQRQISEINAGLYLFAAAWLRQALPRLHRSPAGEIYLTDLVELAVADAQPGAPWPVVAVSAGIEEALGVNDRVQLAEANRLWRARINERLMRAGVTLIDPASTYIDDSVTIGADTVIWPGSVITGPTVIGADCIIGPHAQIRASRIGDRCRIVASVIEESSMEADADVGPYSHLRAGAHLHEHVHVGNFAEIKNATLGPATAMGHFSYIGDATIGEQTNIGAGTITANWEYYTRQKMRTTIGDHVYLGCDTVLIAPVTVGDRATTGAGAVVNRDVAPDTLVVGLPARPIRRTGKPPST